MFWNKADDQTIDLSIGKYYSEFQNMRATTPEGYRCDPLQSSPVLFMGSCCINGPLNDTEATWSRIIYKELSKAATLPYIALARIYTGTDALLRRLHGYCEQYGAPKTLYVVLPRPSGIEVPFRGTLISVGAHATFADYLLKIGRITPKEHSACIKAVEFYKTQQDSLEFHLYKFEQAAAMLKNICERYGIELKWTPNISATGTDYNYQWMPTFLQEVPWMAETCMGVGVLTDFAHEFDNSCGIGSQAEMARVLMGEKNSIESILQQLKDNQNLLINNWPVVHQQMLRNTNR